MNQEENSQDKEEGFRGKKIAVSSISTFIKITTLILFIVLPLIGVWIGYINSPIKTVEVEKIVIKEVESESELDIENTEVYSEETVLDEPEFDYIKTASENRVNINSLYEFSLPYDWDEEYYNRTLDSIEFLTYSIDYVYGSSMPRMRVSDLSVSNYHFILMASERPSGFIGHFEHILKDSSLSENDREHLIGSLEEEKTKEELKDEVIKYLQSGEFPISRFETTNERFAGVARFDNYTECFDLYCNEQEGSNVQYRLYLIDRFFGDVIELSIKIDGEEFEEIRTAYADEFAKENVDHDLFSRIFADLIESKSRNELSFGYLLDDIEALANSLTGIDERYSEYEKSKG